MLQSADALSAADLEDEMPLATQEALLPRGPLSTPRALRVALATMLGATALFANSVSALASTGATVPASPSNIGVTWSVSGSGTSSDPTTYVVAVDDCRNEPTDTLTLVLLNASTTATDLGKWFMVDVECGSAGTPGTDFDLDFDAVDIAGTPNQSRSALDRRAAMTFALNPTGVSDGSPFFGGIQLTVGSKKVSFFVGAVAGSGGGGGGGSSPTVSDPLADAVARAVEQSVAAGLEGTSNGLRVRGTDVVPVTTRIVPTVGPRGGVIVSSPDDDLEVRVASSVGARADAGVIVPERGMFETSVSGPLVPGSVIEVWILSTPRLVAAAAVPEDGGAVTFAVPTGTPLDGGEPIEAGEHTLQLRMYTEDGLEIVSTGLTIGAVAPISIPAGEGPAAPSGLVGLVLAAIAGVVVAVRRGQAVAG